MSTRKDLTGKKYGNLTVLSYSHTENSHAVWKVICGKCNRESLITASNLKSGNSNGSLEISERIYLTDGES